MFPSQASYTFNPLLPFTLSVSVPYISFDVLASFSGTPILQSVVDFISPSHSSSTIFKSTTNINAHPTQGDISQGDDRISAQYSLDFLEDTVSRLFGNYRRLYSAMKDINNSNHPQGLDFPQKAHILAEIKQFKRYAINLLCRLAALTLEYPQESLVNYVYMVYSALASLNSFRASLQEHQSSNIYEIVTVLFNTPMTLENSLYINYIKNKSTNCEQDQDTSAKILSIRCPTAKNLVCETSSNLIEMLRTKKRISCPEEDIEEESERHERSSTTSASSRTNPCEVDLPQTYNVFGGSPQSNKTASASKEKDINEITSMHEIYDGCFFGDLTITFTPTDKILFQIDESNDKETNGHYSWRKNSYNYNKNTYTKYNNYSKPPVFTPNQNTYPNFNPRIEEPAWKGTSAPTFEPSLLKTPPTAEQKIIPLNLFTLPQGTLLPTTGFNLFNPGNVVMPGSVQQMNTPPSFNNKRVPATVEAPRTVQAGLSDQKIRDKSWESHSSFQSDKQTLKPNKVASVTVNKTANPMNAPKNLLTQTNKNGNAAKKPSSQNAKKKQDKGGFKLWDMISVQGKLKNF